MRPTKVEATFSSSGQPKPRSFTWESIVLMVRETGRRWDDGMGHHLLARVMDNRVFELVYNGVEWQVDLISQPPQVI